MGLQACVDGVAGVCGWGCRRVWMGLQAWRTRGPRSRAMAPPAAPAGRAAAAPGGVVTT
jgi:hypothetical protein